MQCIPKQSVKCAPLCGPRLIHINHISRDTLLFLHVYNCSSIHGFSPCVNNCVCLSGSDGRSAQPTVSWEVSHMVV